MPKPTSVDAYIDAQPKNVQPMLRQLRSIIRKAAPKAEEKISYSMPYYDYHGRLAYFAAFKDHVGLFAMPPIVEKYTKQLTITGKSTIRFEIDEKLPVKIITELVKAGMKRNEEGRKKK